MKNKLNGRDFITIGIFNAISIVIYMAVAFALATTVVGGFIASGVAFMVAAITYCRVRRTYSSCNICDFRRDYLRFYCWKL